MAPAKTITVYSDYKSPYAFLAKDLIYGLEDGFEARLDWLPYTLDFPSYLGSARPRWSNRSAGSSNKTTSPSSCRASVT